MEIRAVRKACKHVPLSLINLFAEAFTDMGLFYYLSWLIASRRYFAGRTSMFVCLFGPKKLALGNMKQYSTVGQLTTAKNRLIVINVGNLFFLFALRAT